MPTLTTRFVSNEAGHWVKYVNVFMVKIEWNSFFLFLVAENLTKMNKKKHTWIASAFSNTVNYDLKSIQRSGWNPRPTKRVRREFYSPLLNCWKNSMFFKRSQKINQRHNEQNAIWTEKNTIQ